MDQQTTQEEVAPRNTVTLSLDGDSTQCLQSYKRAVGHFRAWNRSKGIKIDVSSVYGGQREVYTTPPSGTFYFVVRSGGRKLTFVIRGRSAWLVGFYGQNGSHQLILDEQGTPYMQCKDLNILSFKGNHRYISDSDPGNTRIGLHSMINAFIILWSHLAQNPEPHQLRRAIGIYVVFLCEAPKNQAIFDRVCRSFLDSSISRLDAEDGPESQLGECCQNWSKLSRQGMHDMEHRIGCGDEVGPQIDNCGIFMIVTAEDILRVIRILHRDAYETGVFTHEPIPSPPQQWEPIELGEGDSSEDEAVPRSNDDESDDDDEYRRRGGRKKEKKYDKRRKTPQFPDHLIDTWSIDPVKKTKMLDLSQCHNITDVRVSSILKSVSNLLELDLSYCCPVTPPMVRTFQKIPKLQTLKLEGCKFMADGLKSIGTSCVSLRELSLSKCSGVTDAEFSFAASRLKNLLKLDITCCRNITDVSLAAITSSCTSLISLRMESCSHVSSRALQLIGKHCSHLEELDLTDSDLDDEGLKALGRCTKLSSLKIGICLKISDEGLTHVGRSCPKLRDIDLYRCGGLSEDGIIQIAQGCPMLESINLSYCTEITDRSLISLSKCSKLNTLEIRGCPRVSSIGLSEIAMGCRLLSKLDIKKCFEINDVGMLYLSWFSSHCLRQVNLLYCSVTDVGLLTLCGISGLQNMTIILLAGITPHGSTTALVVYGALRKVKLHEAFKSMISHMIKNIEAHSFAFSWINELLKPLKSEGLRPMDQKAMCSSSCGPLTGMNTCVDVEACSC